MTTRRAMLGILAGAPLAACQSTQTVQGPIPTGLDAESARWYVGSMNDGEYDVPLVDRSLLDPDLRPQTVAYSGGERPGTVLVNIDEKRLYLVQADGTAMRYGVGVGRQGYSYRGMATVGRKARWPSWTPTSHMVRLRPNLARYAGPGLANPLGARALYLYQGKRDTMFRIHGTNEPWSIGTQVSSGCIRMLNQDAIDLYERVPVGATVIVRGTSRYGA